MRDSRKKTAFKAVGLLLGVSLLGAMGVQAANALTLEDDPVTTDQVVTEEALPAPDSEANTTEKETTVVTESEDTQDVVEEQEGPAPSSARVNAQGGEPEHVEVEICHANNSVDQPYGPKRITVDDDAVDGVGGSDHYGEHTGPLASTTAVAQDLKDNHIQWGDIIPPLAGVHDGLNWTAEGQAIWEADCVVPTPPPTCVDDPSWSYTFDPATGSGVITVTGGEEGDALCEPLAVRAAAWTYDTPAFGSPSWPQTLDGYNDTTVDKIGAFNYGPPQLENCRQYDIYASFGGFDELELPTNLIGSHNPSEPAFLHETLNGFGPNPTYSFTSSAGCNPPQECIADFDPATGYVNPDEVGKEPTQVENGLEFGKGDLIHFPAGLISAVGLHDLAYTIESSTGPSPAYKMEVFANGTTGYGTWNWETSNNGYALNATGTFSNLENGNWWSSKIPSGPGSISQPIPYVDLVAIYDGATRIISFGTGIGSTTESVAVVSSQTFLCGTGDFTDPPAEVEPDSPIKVNVCGIENDSFTLPGAEPNELESITSEGTYTADDLPTEDGIVAVTFVPADGFVVKDDPNAEYEVDENGNAVWILVFTDEPCPVAVKPAVQHVVICGADNDTVTTAGTAVENAEGITETEEFYYVIDPDGTDTPGTITASAIPKDGITVAEPGEGDTYVIDGDGNASWTFVDDDEACASPGLALTGSNPMPLVGLGALLLAIGTLAVAGARRKPTGVV